MTTTTTTPVADDTDTQTAGAGATDAPETVPEPATGQEPTTPDEPDADDQDEAEKGPGGREARLRRRAQAAETEVATLTGERDALLARLDVLHRGEVERLAADMHRPADLWDTGATLDELRDGNGNIDPDTVEARLATIKADRPHLFRSSTITFEAGLGRRGNTHDTGPTWAEVINTRD